MTSVDWISEDVVCPFVDLLHLAVCVMFQRVKTLTDKNARVLFGKRERVLLQKEN